MKKKYLRIVLIAALVLALAVTGFMRMKIEPAVPVPEAAAPAVTQKEPAAPPVEELPKEESSPVEELPKEESSPVEELPKEEETSVVEEPPTVEEPPAVEEPPLPEVQLCTIEIRCDTVADTTKLENPAVAPFIPADGVILPKTELEHTPGESVFDVLLRVVRENDIHMEFREDNLYSGKYIEGINYLYEMDGGPLSGWMYKVNEKFPNYGCAAYEVKDGDAIVWVYTCDLGMDVGDNSTW